MADRKRPPQPPTFSREAVSGYVPFAFVVTDHKWHEEFERLIWVPSMEVGRLLLDLWNAGSGDRWEYRPR